MKDAILVVIVAAVIGVAIWKWKDIKGWFEPKKDANTEGGKSAVDCTAATAYRYVFDLATVQKQRKMGEPERSTASAVDVIKNIFDYSVTKKGAATDNGKWEGLKGNIISFVAKRNVSTILDGGFNAVGLKYEKICLTTF
jgi:hypothetical protein